METQKSATRRVWVGLVAALPAVLVSLHYLDVFLHPEAGSNPEWAEDAQLLIKLEFMMIFVTAFTAWIAGQVTAAHRVAAMGALGAAFGAIVYAIWLGTDGSSVVLGVGLLIAGRFVAAVIAGPEAVVEFSERAAMAALFYFAILFVAFVLPELLPQRYGFRLQHPAAAFCGLYYLMLALLDAAQIYVGTPEPASRRATVVLARSEAMTQSSLRLRFAGDGLEVVAFERLRPAGRIMIFFMGTAAIGVSGAFFLPILFSRRHADADAVAVAFLSGLVALAPGVVALYISLRGGTNTAILQVRPRALAVLNLSNNRLGDVVELTDAEAGFQVMRDDNAAVLIAVTRKAGDETLMQIRAGWRNEAAASSLVQLIELYLSGDPSPRGLVAALKSHPELAAMLSPAVLERLQAAPPLRTLTGTSACTACGSEIAAGALRCGYCGLLYPAQEN